MENPSENNRKYLEVNLIAPRSLEVKYQNERYRSVIGGVSQFLMVLANMVGIRKAFNPLRPSIKLQILLLCFHTFLTEVVKRSC